MQGSFRFFGKVDEMQKTVDDVGGRNAEPSIAASPPTAIPQECAARALRAFHPAALLSCKADSHTATRWRTKLGCGLQYYQNENSKSIQESKAQRPTNI
jgi:hypothetical protein